MVKILKENQDNTKGSKSQIISELEKCLGCPLDEFMDDLYENNNGYEDIVTKNNVISAYKMAKKVSVKVTGRNKVISKGYTFMFNVDAEAIPKIYSMIDDWDLVDEYNQDDPEYSDFQAEYPPAGEFGALGVHSDEYNDRPYFFVVYGEV